MQTRLASATAATTAIAAAFIGCTSGIAPTEAPSPTPTVAATLAPSPSPALTLATSPSPPAVVTHSSVEFEPAFTYEAPAAWSTFDESQEGYVIGAGTPDAIVLQTDPIIATDAEQCEGLAAPGGATTVDGIIAALSSDPRLVSEAPAAVAIGGFEGKRIDIQLDPAWTGTCKWSGGKPAALILTTPNPPGPFLGILGPDRVRLILLDVGDYVVSIGIDSADGATFDALVSEAMPIVASFKFAP